MTEETDETRRSESVQDFRQTLVQIRAWEAGDAAALDGLFRRYYPIVRRIVAWRMTDAMRRLAEIDDLVQDALLKAFRSVGSFQEQSDASFKSWLAKIVENHIKDELRNAHAGRRDLDRQQRFAADRTEGPTPSAVAGREATPSHVAMQGEMLAAARARDARREAAIAGLEPTYREVLNLRENCGMTFDEMGAALGKKPDTARMMYRRVVERLEKQLDSS